MAVRCSIANKWDHGWMMGWMFHNEQMGGNKWGGRERHSDFRSPYPPHGGSCSE